MSSVTVTWMPPNLGHALKKEEEGGLHTDTQQELTPQTAVGCALVLSDHQKDHHGVAFIWETRLRFGQPISIVHLFFVVVVARCAF